MGLGVQWESGREWVVWYFLAQTPPVGVQKRLETFHRRYIDYLSRLFIQKRKNPNSKCVLAIGCITRQLLQLIGMTTYDWVKIDSQRRFKHLKTDFLWLKNDLHNHASKLMTSFLFLKRLSTANLSLGSNRWAAQHVPLITRSPRSFLHIHHDRRCMMLLMWPELQLSCASSQIYSHSSFSIGGNQRLAMWRLLSRFRPRYLQFIASAQTLNGCPTQTHRQSAILRQ